jgi:hypothetical protein
VIPQTPGKPEFFENDPERLDQLLELQLTQKRNEWKKATSRYRLIRTLSFIFLFLVIVGGLVAFFLIFTGLRHG